MPRSALLGLGVVFSVLPIVPRRPAFYEAQKCETRTKMATADPPNGPLFSQAFIEKLRHWIATHHTIYPHLPPQGIYFESLVERAFLHTGWPRDQVVLTHPNSPRADIT